MIAIHLNEKSKEQDFINAVSEGLQFAIAQHGGGEIKFDQRIACQAFCEQLPKDSTLDQSIEVATGESLPPGWKVVGRLQKNFPKATVRVVTPEDSGDIGIGFDVAMGPTIRLRLRIDQAQALAHMLGHEIAKATEIKRMRPKSGRGDQRRIRIPGTQTIGVYEYQRGDEWKLIETYPIVPLNQSAESLSAKAIADALVCSIPFNLELTDKQFEALVAKRNELGRMLTDEETLEVLKSDPVHQSS